MSNFIMSDGYVGCPICKGAKKIMGLGYIFKDCVHCKGVGYTSKPGDDVKPVEPIKSWIENKTDGYVEKVQEEIHEVKPERFERPKTISFGGLTETPIVVNEVEKIEEIIPVGATIVPEVTLDEAAKINSANPAVVASVKKRGRPPRIAA
jgi:hypothetical protein